MKAKNFLEKALNILENIANINIFDVKMDDSETVLTENDDKKEGNDKFFEVIIDDSLRIPGKSARNCFVNVAKKLIENPDYYNVLVVDGPPLSRQDGNGGKYIGTQGRTTPSGYIPTVPISDDLVLYANFNLASTKKAIEKMAKDIGVTVAFNF